jgi:hypothetical protein
VGPTGRVPGTGSNIAPSAPIVTSATNITNETKQLIGALTLKN